MKASRRLQKQQEKAMAGANSQGRNGNSADLNYQNQSREAPAISAESFANNEGRLKDAAMHADNNNFDGKIQDQDGMMIQAMQPNIPPAYVRSRAFPASSIYSCPPPYTPYDAPQIPDYYLINNPMMGGIQPAEPYASHNIGNKSYHALDSSFNSYVSNGFAQKRALCHATIAYRIYNTQKQPSYYPPSVIPVRVHY